MPTSEFYPSLDKLLPTGRLPAKLGFLLGSLSELLERLFYKELQIHTSSDGSSESYRLTIVSYGRFGFAFPGTDGLALVVNPGDRPGTTEIPVSLEWRLDILRYLGSADLRNFSGEPRAFFDLFLEMFDIEPRELLAETLEALSEAVDPLEEFVEDFNEAFGDPITSYADLDDVLSQVEGLTDPVEALFSLRFDLQDLSIDDLLDRVRQVFRRWTGPASLDDVFELFIPQIRAAIYDIDLALEFPRSVLVPLETADDLDPGTDLGEPLPEPFQSRLTFHVGSIHFSSANGLDFRGESAFEFEKSQIGKTGLTLSFEKMRVDLSRTRNIPEAIQDGRPEDFIGVYAEEATIGLPEKWFKKQGGATAEIFGRRLIIGTGGISGRIGLEAIDPSTTEPELAFELGKGFILGFQSFDILFQQNAILESNIRGFLTIPGFKDAAGDDAKVEVDVHFGTDGDFKVTAREADGIAIRLADVVEIVIRSLTVGRKDDRFFAAVSGKLSFLDVGGFLEDKLPKDLEIQKLLIWDDGNIEIEGGSLELRDPKPLKVPPVELTITAIHLGSHEQMHGPHLRRYKYVGLDGGLSVKPGGIDARGDGFKVYFTVDNDRAAGRKLHVFVRIESIAIDLIIPGDAKPESASLLLSGYLAVKEPSPGSTASNAGREYAGAVNFTLPKLKMGGSAAMRYNPRLPSFLIDVGLEISNPILLGSTGLGIYGFRGLVGRHFVASREHVGLEEDAKWYQYYKKKAPPEYREGVQPGKFAPTEGFSLGAGVSLATAADAGKTFSSKIFFLLSLPEVFLLEGQAQILKERIGLDSKDDPPFYALIAITNRSLEAALGVNYRVPDDGGRPGAIATVDGLLELGFFFGDSSAWYLNLGQESPDTKRIQVTLLSLFNAYFYMMLSSSGIRAGAGASFGLKKRYGPVKVELGAYLDVAARISFERKQLGGSIQLGGSVGLKIFRFGFRISVDASLAAEAPRPFIVTGSVKVCVRVLRKKRCVRIGFTWTFDKRLDMSEIPVLEGPRSAQALSILTREAFPLFVHEGPTIPDPATWGEVDNYIIPLDSFLDLEFAQAVNPRGAHPSLARLGGVTHAAQHVQLLPPRRGKSPQVKHQFFVERVEIKCWQPQTAEWKDYDIYQAATPLAHLPRIDPQDLVDLKQGFWQLDHPARYNKLRLLAQTPFSYVTQGAGELALEELGVGTETLFCADEGTPPRCVRLADIAGPLERLVPGERPLYAEGVLFRLRGGDGEVLSEGVGGDIQRVLGLRGGQVLEVDFPEPVVELSLSLRTIALGVRVRYFERLLEEQKDSSGLPVYRFEEIRTDSLPTGQPMAFSTYDDAKRPVDRVVVEADLCPRGERTPGFLRRYEHQEPVLFNGLIEGVSPKQIVTFGRIGRSGLVAAFDLEGRPLWSRRYEPPGDAPLNLTSGLLGPDGNLIISGSLATGDGRQRHVVLRLTKSGAVVWSYTYGHPHTRFHRGLARLGNHAYAFTGWNGPGTVDDIELVRIDEQGQVLLRTRIGGGADEQVEGIVPHDEGVLLFGETSEGGWDGFLAGFDRSFSHRWGVRLRTSRFDRVQAVLPLDSLEFLVAGITASGGSSTTPSTFVMRYHIRFGTQEAQVFDLFGNRSDHGSAKLLQVGKFYYLLARASAGERSPRLVKLAADLSIRWVQSLEFENDHLLSDFVSSSPGFHFAGRIFGAGNSQTGLLATTNRNFASCAMVREQVPEVTVVPVEDTHWKPTSTELQLKREPLRLRVGEVVLKGSALCPPACDPKASSTFLGELCYRSQSVVEHDATIVAEEDVQADNDAMLRGLHGAIQPVWRPSTTFAVHVRTLDQVSASGQQSHEYRRSFTFGFRTAGPVGHFHEYLTSQGIVDLREDYEQLLLQDREDQYKLATLRPYIDYRRSYPNADGRLTLAKPLFYLKPRLELFFLRDYVASMYGDWDSYQGLEEVHSALEAVVLDPLDSAAEPARFAVTSAWRRRGAARDGGEGEVVDNLLAHGDPCTTVESGRRLGVFGQVGLPDLLPSKAYTVRLDALVGPAAGAPRRQEVHRYVFQTSRYGDFREQVLSYRLASEAEPGAEAVVGEAVFEIDRPFDGAALSTARAVLKGTANDDLVQRFADPFDRLLVGALGLEALPPAETTEWNVLRRGTRVLGFLLRSPEPFNDPKMPAAELARTVRVEVAGVGAFQTVHSKDASQVFVTDRSATFDLPIGTYRFSLEYRLWNGKIYRPVSSVDDLAIEVH